MKPLLLAITIVIGTLFFTNQSAGAANVSLSSSCKSADTKHVIMLHGGSLSRPKNSGTVKFAKKREKAIISILKKGEKALDKGATALEVVAYVVSEMEDSGPLMLVAAQNLTRQVRGSWMPQSWKEKLKRRVQ